MRNDLAELEMNSKLGLIYIQASPVGLKNLFFTKPALKAANSNQTALKIVQQTEMQLSEYLKGQRKKFDLPLDLYGTEFQKKVWNQLLQIPYGQTASYKDIAFNLSDANASRAVGTANGKNPICIIVPCHRIITSSGQLGGYSGGLHRKKQLLNIEGLDLWKN